MAGRLSRNRQGYHSVGKVFAHVSHSTVVLILDLRFHCVYWPAFLLALDLPLPRQILTHAHWTLGREKMSKSTGNVVNPFFAIDRFGADTIRYYLAHDGGISQDADYGNEYIIQRYKKGLQGGLGNLASRTMRGKGWDVRIAVVRGTRGELLPNDDATEAQCNIIQQTTEKVEQTFEKSNVGAALQEIMNLIYAVGSLHGGAGLVECSNGC